MKALSLEEVADPGVGVGKELITVEIAGIGGSEYQGYISPGIRPLPNIMGHGFAGTAGDGSIIEHSLQSHPKRLLMAKRAITMNKNGGR